LLLLAGCAAAVPADDASILGDIDDTPIQRPELPTGQALTAADILASTTVISHGMGAVEEEVDTGGVPLNCLEGFLYQYSKGVRVFEADLRLTRDAQVVLRHDWWPTTWQEGINGAAIPTREEFVSKPILGQYTPLSFQDLLKLMDQYPDICVVTDTKFTDPDVIFVQFGAMLADAEELGLTDVFDRLVVQIYDGVMRQCMDNIYPFPNYIYTLYQRGFDQTEEDFREVVEYCAANGIAGITMPYEWWDSAYAAIAQEYGLAVYVHTVNDADEAARYLREGVAAVYTDSLSGVS
jgi:glycerophosphoryl diester phosphodiesterase